MKLLLYCTKAKPYLEYKQIPRTLMEIDNSFEGYRCSYKRTEDDENFQLNGKIVAECDFEVEELQIVDDDPLGAYWYETKTLSENEVLEQSCLSSDELFEYLGEYNEGYAIHIKNLHIFDETKELDECERFTTKYGGIKIENVKKAPQNMMSVMLIEKGLDEYTLISIKPQEMCRIANGEQTTLVRKKVLKEMMK